MSETNRKTIEAYDDNIGTYVAKSPQALCDTAKTWLDTSLNGLSPEARILEIGSGFGRDAAYVERLGFNVERTDATPGFVELLRSQGHEATRLNVLTDQIEGPYDLIFADAVLHHLTYVETTTAVRNVFEGLKIGGRFAAGLRLGLCEGWSNEKLGAPRYFTHWDRSDMEELVRNVGFASIVGTDSPRVALTWLHFVSTKG